MISGSFAFYRPHTIAEAVAMLATHGDAARLVAGGHSLIPMMKLRMAMPDHLIDVGGIADLKGIKRDGSDWLIGALTTQAELIADQALAAGLPVLRETALQIADPQVRNCGTLGGNIANGDPGNDMPAVMLCLNARFEVTGPGGKRSIPARGFYHGAYVTSLAQDEIVTAVRIAALPPGSAAAYEKLKRKVGDYATAAAAVALGLQDGKINFCSIALTNLAPTPLWAEAAGQALIGRAPGAESFALAGRLAEEITDPSSDARGPAAYRTKMGGVMVRRALARAALAAKT
ncbi:MAG: carbon monoxide dehydrogenase [Rhodospirillales bacterium 20-60-12]|nr:MAG: carbon monoxide dehydrogenase [Rhodospirillales bacterium 20-60-12]HQT67672.1 xanthine dehydrogenase family protein subunit M [Acetobacteraceae bacterium]